MTPEEKAAQDAAAAAAAEAEKKKIEFSTEQQEQINKIFDTRFSKINAKHAEAQKAKDDEIAALRAQLEELESKKGGKKDGGETDAEKAQIAELLKNEKNQTKAAKDALAAKESEATSLKSKLADVEKTIAIEKAAGGKFLDMELVMTLVKDRIEYDPDTKTYIVRENGIVRQNSSLQNMSVEEYLMEVGAKRPYLVRSDVRSGAGSAESNGKPGELGTVKSKADLKTAKDKSDYIKKFGLKKFEELPLK